ncbi:hypothetical protein N692_10445 [Lactiplantibacillus plantarum EGD-AQ4]|nr:hypothetical protein N692_10445 [Lactiplantibacillus plantarum EGD-AQ4]
MILDHIDPYSDKLQSLQQLRVTIEIGMDIQIKIHDTEWYIGPLQGKRLISKNNDDFMHMFETDNPDEVLNDVIDGQRIRDQWRDVVIVSM